MLRGEGGGEDERLSTPKKATSRKKNFDEVGRGKKRHY